MKKQTAEIKLRGPNEAVPLRVVSDAMIATAGVGDGRMVPLVILDTSNRPDVEELIRVHEHISPGDAESVWAQLDERKGRITLVLTFIRPMALTCLLEFDILRQGALVDRIIAARALYIQAGRDGDRLTTAMGRPRIIVDIPHGGFEDKWDKVLTKAIVRDYRARGLSRSESKLATQRFIKEWRRVTGLRVRG